jgi:hypothetical protein
VKTARVGGLAVTALLVSMQSHAANDGAPGSPVRHVSADRLDLRVPPSAATAPLFARAQGPASRSPPIRLEPRKSLIEQGIEGSREALIACQQGAYPGATVSASAVKVAGGEAQPDHCYRF